MKLTLHAYVTPYSPIRGQDVHTVDAKQLASGLTFSGHDQMPGDWTKVGTAEVEVTLLPRNKVVTDAVAALRAEINDVQARAGSRVAELNERINSLLCIEA